MTLITFDCGVVSWLVMWVSADRNPAKCVTRTSTKDFDMNTGVYLFDHFYGFPLNWILLGASAVTDLLGL